MSIALRALVMLAVVMPLFVAKNFRPLWWQNLLAAILGAALGRLTVPSSRGPSHRRVAWAVGIVAAIIIALTIGWAFLPALRGAAPQSHFLVVRSARGQASLSWNDVAAIELKHVAAPYLYRAESLATEEANWKTQLIGTTPNYFDIRRMHIAAGDWLTASDASNKVVVLGETVATRLFGAGQRPIGETVRIKNMMFTIVGVLAHQGMTAEGQDLDDVALMPIEVYQSRIAIESKFRFSGVVFVAAANPELVESELSELLRDRHRLPPGSDDDFVIVDPNSKR